MYCTPNNSTVLCCTEDIPTYKKMQDTNHPAERNSFVSRGVSVYKNMIDRQGNIFHFDFSKTCNKMEKSAHTSIEAKISTGQIRSIQTA